MSDQERKAISVNAGAIVTAVAGIAGVIFSSGLVVQELRHAIVMLREIQTTQREQHVEFIQFKDDMMRRVMELERKTHVLDAIDINALRGLERLNR